jgi:serine/threonine-protein phosphatase 4 catalytic subunit
MKNIEKYIFALKDCKLPSENEIKCICEKAKEILVCEDNLIRLSAPISVCGDLHGQFYDLLELFEFGDTPPETSYCFMGDYVDRGHHSIETFLFLILLKIRYPQRMTLLRGNHECRSITKAYGFYDECLKKFGCANVYNYFTDVFDLLPLTAIINDNLFVVHGGLSPKLDNISDINNLNRKKEIPIYGIVSDFMWSDPNEQKEEWAESERGAGFTFNEIAVKKFNETNNLDCIFRSHQLTQNGYHYMFDKTICIVWSAPNYCYRCGNTAAILEIDDVMKRHFNIFGPSTLSYTTNKDDTEENDIYNEWVSKPSYFL